MSADTTERICAIIRRVSKQKEALAVALPVDADVFRELGVESTAALDLLLSLEEEFGISIPDDQFGDARTIRLLAELATKLGAT